jgi:hypothetical protein
MRTVLLAWMMACSGGPTPPEIVDGSQPDSLGDGSDVIPTCEVSSITGAASIRVIGTDGPVAGLPVFFSDADGTFRGSTNTDNDGLAVGEVETGGSVSTISHVPGQLIYRIETVQCVAPGDEIVIASSGSSSSSRSFDVEFTPHPGMPFYYAVYSACGSATQVTSTRVTLNVDSGCQGQTIDLFVITNQTGFGDFVEKRDVPFVDGGSTTMPANWQPLPETKLTLTDPQDPFRIVRVEREFAIGKPGATDRTYLAPRTPNAKLTVDWSDSGKMSQVVREIIDGSISNYELDLRAIALPYLDASFDPLAGAVRLVPSAGATPDIMKTILNYGDGSFANEWVVFSPYQTMITFPDLPPDLGIHSPGPQDQGFVDSVDVIETPAIADYKAARRDPYAALRIGSLPRTIGTRVRTSHYQ